MEEHIEIGKLIEAQSQLFNMTLHRHMELCFELGKIAEQNKNTLISESEYRRACSVSTPHTPQAWNRIWKCARNL